MKILLVSPYFYPHKGGSQQYALELYYHLRKFDPKIKVDVVTYNTDRVAAKENYKGFTIYRVPCIQILPGQFALPNYWQLFKLIGNLHKQNNYAFINSHTRFFESSWWVPFAAKLLGTKSMLTDHCATHPAHSSFLVSQIAKLVDKVLVPVVANQYDLVTVTNKATYKFVKSLGIKTPTIVYGGVDVDFFKPYKKISTVKLPKIKKTFKKDDIIISFVGRMIKSKGSQLLLPVAKEITQKNRNVYFIFAGGGKMYDQLKKNSSNQIFFVGPLEKDETRDLMRKSDILVHPSIHHEGFPNVLLEAGACGCAVVATDRGGTTDIIIDGKTGLITAPDIKSVKDKITQLIENEAKRKHLGASLRKWVVKNYSWDPIVKDYQKVLSKFVPSH